ncbi:MAG: hypothetical protein Q8P27_03610 [Candidatus Peregrinibacteria bacterium]|nr:hypothetical protein [Candidatus Peregrinibacteria bacterium]
MLEHKFGPNSKPDIKFLSLEGMEKREEGWFDMKAEILDEERSVIQEALFNLEREILRDRGWEEEYLKLAYLSKCTGITVPKLITRSQGKLLEHIKERHHFNNWYFLIHEAGYMKAAFSLGNLKGVGLNSTFYEAMKEHSDAYGQNIDWYSYLSTRVSLGLLFPAKLNELRPDDIEFRAGREKAWRAIEEYRSGKGGSINLVMGYCLLAELRLFNPDADLGINQKARKEMREYFDLTRKTLKEHPDNVIQCQYFTEMAMIMTILGAYRAELTKNGIEIKHRGQEEIEHTLPPIPNQRNF